MQQKIQCVPSLCTLTEGFVAERLSNEAPIILQTIARASRDWLKMSLNTLFTLQQTSFHHAWHLITAHLPEEYIPFVMQREKPNTSTTTTDLIHSGTCTRTAHCVGSPSASSHYSPSALFNTSVLQNNQKSTPDDAITALHFLNCEWFKK